MSASYGDGRPDGREPDSGRKQPRGERVPDDDGERYQSRSHIDPDQLAALALDPRAGDLHESEHLVDCVRCRRELETLREVTDRARRSGRAEPLPLPPEGVWDSVVRELSGSGDLAPRRARPAPRWQSFALAAALVVAAVLAAGILLPLTGSEVVATATLEPLADVTQARVELVTEGDQRTLTLDDLDLPETDGYYELWLLTREGDGLISLGPVGPGATVEVPTAIDTDRFSVVDISREPQDGDPAHSTDSVLRGPLQPQV
jgi:hypothetical protein